MYKILASVLTGITVIMDLALIFHHRPCIDHGIIALVALGNFGFVYYVIAKNWREP